MTRWQREWLDLMTSEGDRLVRNPFAYDRLTGDWSINFPNGLPEHLVYLVVAGSAVGAVAGERVDLLPGTLFWLRPRRPFHLHAGVDSGLTLYRLRISTSAPGWPEGLLTLPDAWDLRGTFDALIIELSGALPFRAERLRALLVVLFSGIFRATAAHPRTPPLDADQRAALESYVDARLHHRLGAADLAQVVGLSEDYFVRRFRQTFGVAPRSWLVRRRIQAAMLRLDDSTQPVGAVARDFGYPDVFLFSRQFKSVTGVSPRSWRERGSKLR